MGCTSSKPRTTSIEDLTTKDQAPKSGSQSKNKNGQVAANDVVIKREKTNVTSAAPPSDTSAIQIPGAHKSFLAPDGIPFIDEDVDDEYTGTTGVPIENDVKPDVNKNVVVNKPQATEVPPSKNTFPEQPKVVVAGQPPQPELTPVQRQDQEEEEKKRAIAMDVLAKELEIASAAAETNAAAPGKWKLKHPTT